jgi:hypothetical protein
MRAKGIHLHIDNAKPHNSEISLSKTDEMGFIRVPQPLYSPVSPHATSFFSNTWKKNEKEEICHKKTT